jgi:3-hydroxybutyryl-CoA dehydrogenase
MKVMVIANVDQEQEIRSKKLNSGVELFFKNEIPDTIKDFDTFFILTEDFQGVNFEDFGGKPVFINAVIDTLSQLQFPKNISRINGWSGFLQRDTWEVASENKIAAKAVFNILDWEIIFVRDEPGFVAARVISMIINEAFFAFKEKVSTREEIDLAMKLGTNYPYGPFEWAEKIGLKNIFKLLKKLFEKETRYLPSFEVETSIK